MISVMAAVGKNKGRGGERIGEGQGEFFASEAFTPGRRF